MELLPRRGIEARGIDLYDQPARQRTHSAGFDYHPVKPLAIGELNELLKITRGNTAPVVTLVKRDFA